MQQTSPPEFHPQFNQIGYARSNRYQTSLVPLWRLIPVFLIGSCAFLAALLGLLGLPQPIWAAGYHYVAPTGVDSSSCSIITPCRTIQQAVDNAATGDEIRVAG